MTSTVDAYMQSGRLKDRKTGRNKPTTYPQQGNYSRTLRAHGYNVSGLDFEFIPRRKNTQPVGEIISIDQAVAETLAMETVAHIERDVTAWEASGDPGVFQANPGSFLCSENYCPAFGSTWCHAWKLKPQKKDQK